MEAAGRYFCFIQADRCALSSLVEGERAFALRLYMRSKFLEYVLLSVGHSGLVFFMIMIFS